MAPQACPFCFSPPVQKGDEWWCDKCNFQMWPVKETGLGVSVQEVKSGLDSANGAQPLLVDVRRPDEVEFTKIEKSVSIPLATLPSRCDELSKDKPIVTYCHHGVRSAFAARLLRQRGFKNVKSMDGGIDAWADVDGSVQKY